MPKELTKDQQLDQMLTMINANIDGLIESIKTMHKSMELLHERIKTLEKKCS